MSKAGYKTGPYVQKCAKTKWRPDQLVLGPLFFSPAYTQPVENDARQGKFNLLGTGWTAGPANTTWQNTASQADDPVTKGRFLYYKQGTGHLYIKYWASLLSPPPTFEQIAGHNMMVCKTANWNADWPPLPPPPGTEIWRAMNCQWGKTYHVELSDITDTTVFLVAINGDDHWHHSGGEYGANFAWLDIQHNLINTRASDLI